MSNDLLETLIEESECGHVAYTQFMLSYSKNNINMLYCFFEGNDDIKYYGSRIKLITDKELTRYICGGKDKVKSAKKLIGNRVEYKDVLTLFFMDKDFSKDKIAGNVYITPCYSIENFYTSTSFFKEVLKNEFLLKEDDPDYDTSLSLFLSLQKKFHDELLIFNAWLKSQHDYKVSSGNKTYLNIGGSVDKYFSSIVKCDLKNISNLSAINDTDIIEQKLFPKAVKINADKLSGNIDYFEDCDKQVFFRGKFEMKFSISFLKKLKDEICKKDSLIFNKKHKCSFLFDYANAISTLSQYADTPSCLRGFILSNSN